MIELRGSMDHSTDCGAAGSAASLKAEGRECLPVVHQSVFFLLCHSLQVWLRYQRPLEPIIPLCFVSTFPWVVKRKPILLYLQSISVSYHLLRLLKFCSFICVVTWNVFWYIYNSVPCFSLSVYLLGYIHLLPTALSWKQMLCLFILL